MDSSKNTIGADKACRDRIAGHPHHSASFAASGFTASWLARARIAGSRTAFLNHAIKRSVFHAREGARAFPLVAPPNSLAVSQRDINSLLIRR